MKHKIETGTDRTLAKGLILMEQLATKGEAAGVSELSRACRLTKSSTHRLLQTLKRLGYVRQQTKGGNYGLTLRLWEFGMLVYSRVDLLKAAAPHMRRLADQTSETVHLSVLDDGDVIYIDKIESSLPARIASRKGGRAPAYCVATGKVLLAYAPSEVQQRAVSHCTAFTPTTLVDKKELVRAFGRIREQGYAYNLGEWLAGIHSLAAPVRDAEGRVIAAIGVSGPANRIGRARLRSFVPVVTRCAGAVSAELGYHDRV